MQCLIARCARCDVRWVAAVFVGADETERRCSAISSCRSAARTSQPLSMGCSRNRALESAAVVVARRGRTPPLASPPCGGARFLTLAAVR